MDMGNVYHLEKILIFPPRDIHCRDLVVRLGNNSDPQSPENEVIHTHLGIVPADTIYDIQVTSKTSGKFVSVISDPGASFFGFASIQVITKEDF